MPKIASAPETAFAIDQNVLPVLGVHDDRNEHALQVDGVGQTIQFILGKIQSRIAVVRNHISHIQFAQFRGHVL
ncbi:hypothetical protein N864_19515 [Intrasporangium chromatireducens Q5-1]|uniref:Uncharacterized protein n=1 Tax=Intrasporangium chromatireducens Q5-1 TaxID=584657 RepID=W9GVI4_9MICO|nr:hypothetical protein N864_19515 [Intrasporangium chromatireducens Q5-1]